MRYHYARNIELSMFTNTMFELHLGGGGTTPPPHHPHQYASVSDHGTVEEKISGLVVWRDIIAHDNYWTP